MTLVMGGGQRKHDSCSNLGLDYSLLFYPFPSLDKEIYFGPTIGLSFFSFRGFSDFDTLPMGNFGGVFGVQYKIKNKLHIIQIKTGIQGIHPDLYLSDASISCGISF